MNSQAENKINMYPYEYTYKGIETILIWQSSSIGPDCFMVNEKNRPIHAHSIPELQKLLGSASSNVFWSEKAVINFDKFWSVIRNLRSGRASSKSTCNLLLDGWNFLEDMGRTFGHDKELELLKDPLINQCYEKIFFGNNLPSVTPKGRSYAPVWLSDEIKALREGLRYLWKLFIAKGYIYMP